MKSYRLHILLIVYSVITLFLPLVCMEETSENDARIEICEQLGIDERVQSALSELKKFNFTALKQTDSGIKYLYKAFAKIFFHKSIAGQLMEEWGKYELSRQELLCDWRSEIFEIEQEFLVVLDYLEDVMVDELESSGEPEESPRNVFALSLVNLIRNLRDKYFPDNRRVDQALGVLRSFNFHYLKRSDKQLEKLYKELLIFFSRKGMIQASIICNLSKASVCRQIKDWDVTGQSFQKNRRVRIQLKVALFESLEFFEILVENFKFEDELLILIQTTRKYMAKRVCQR